MIWKPRDLPMDGEWQTDGPELPIEFARQSENGRLTLVIVPGVRLVTTQWVKLEASNLGEAKTILAQREGTSLANIGQWPEGASHPCAQEVAAWAETKGFKGVVWTALGPKFGGQVGWMPTAQEALAYLSGLTGDMRALAEEYVRKAPTSTRTAYRGNFERVLGWHPAPAGDSSTA